jgi:hypothetical protein
MEFNLLILVLFLVKINIILKSRNFSFYKHKGNLFVFRIILSICILLVVSIHYFVIPFSPLTYTG